MATDRKNDPKAVALVLLTIMLIGAALALRLWANDQRLRVPNVKAMAVAPDGRVHVVLGDTLFIESAAGESLDVVPLERWGVSSFHGDLVALKDGSVILAEGRLGEVGLAEGARLYARAAPGGDDPVEGLMRCHPQTNACAPLAGDDERALFRRAFGITVDADENFLYVSEPGRHRVVQLTLQGDMRAASGDGWRFPNSVRVIDDGRIGFVDTNHHRYVELSAGANGFGGIVYEKSILDWPDVDLVHRFPSEVVKDARGTLWMLVAGTDMGDAWLYRYPRNGQAQRLPLPEGADPMELALLPDGVLVADFRHFRIHRFDLDGRVQEDFGSSALRSHLADLKTQYSRYEQLFDYSLVGVLLIAVPALGIGLYLQYRPRPASGGDGEAETEVVASAEPLPAFSSLEAQYARLHGEFIFWRKFTVLATEDAARLRWLGVVLVAAVLAMMVHVSWRLAEEQGVPIADVLLERRTAAVFAGVALLVVVGWLSAMFERIVITRDGIRYVSFLPAPLDRLLVFQRSWSLRWSEIRSVKLMHSGNGSNQLMWRYEIVTKTGRRHRIHPLSWRLAGEPETGLRLRQAFRQDAAMLRAIIHRTLLYRLLGQQRAATANAADALVGTARA